jgi:hypothetical protein
VISLVKSLAPRTLPFKNNLFSNGAILGVQTNNNDPFI